MKLSPASRAPLTLLALLGLVAPAAAQGSETLGLYFDAAGTSNARTVALNEQFDVYIIADGIPTGLWAYEFSVVVPPEILILQDTAHPVGSALDFGAGPENFIVGTGVCMNGPGPLLLAELRCMLVQDASGLELSLAPSSPSSFNDLFTGYAECTTSDLYTFGEAYPGPATINGSLGSNYCSAGANSVAAIGSRISAQGSASLAAEDLTLSASNAPNQPGIFFYGPNRLDLAFGNGRRCVGGNIVRLPAIFGAGGSFEYSFEFQTFALGTGTHNFQCWYRDPAAGGAFFNLSDALEIVLVP